MQLRRRQLDAIDWGSRRGKGQSIYLGSMRKISKQGMMSATLSMKLELAVEWWWDKHRVAAATMPNGCNFELQLSVVQHEGPVIFISRKSTFLNLFASSMAGSEWSDAEQGKQVGDCLLQPVSSHFAHSTYHFSVARIISYKRSNIWFIPNGRQPFRRQKCRLCRIRAKLPVSLRPWKFTPNFATLLTIRIKLTSQSWISLYLNACALRCWSFDSKKNGSRTHIHV
jgi:hypothetical protein